VIVTLEDEFEKDKVGAEPEVDINYFKTID